MWHRWLTKCGNQPYSTVFLMLRLSRLIFLCTIEPNVGTITVPDERLASLESLVKPEKVIPTTIEIVDIAGLVKGAHKGEGLEINF